MRKNSKMKFLFAILFPICLTSCASYEMAMPRSNLDRIQPGVTTQADLFAMFGSPDTVSATFEGISSYSWFRSAPPPPAGYLPLVGPSIGGFDFDVQQLFVITGTGGRVLSFSMYDSPGELKTEHRLVNFPVTTSGK